MQRLVPRQLRPNYLSKPTAEDRLGSSARRAQRRLNKALCLVKRPRPMKSAWLVTWDWLGDHAERKEPIVAILGWRKSSRQVFEFVEQFYASSFLTPEEQVAVARDRKNNPYPAEYISIQGVRHEGRIICGSNPWLYARIVKNLRLDPISAALLWDEPPVPPSSSREA